jgi:uncharacterized RDD family membrane protein YckC
MTGHAPDWQTQRVEAAHNQWAQQSALAAQVPALPYATFWRRCAVRLLDRLIVAIPTVMLFVLGFVVAWAIDPDHFVSWWQWVFDELDRSNPAFEGGPPAPRVATFLVLILTLVVTGLAGALYEILMTRSPRFRGTLGKYWLGVAVTDLQGNTISGARSTGRYFAKWLYGLSWIGMVFLVVTIVMLLTQQRRQTLHDLMCSTVVVYRDR